MENWADTWERHFSFCVSLIGYIWAGKVPLKELLCVWPGGGRGGGLPHRSSDSRCSNPLNNWSLFILCVDRASSQVMQDCHKESWEHCYHLYHMLLSYINVDLRFIPSLYVITIITWFQHYWFVLMTVFMNKFCSDCKIIRSCLKDCKHSFNKPEFYVYLQIIYRRTGFNCENLKSGVRDSQTYSINSPPLCS